MQVANLVEKKIVHLRLRKMKHLNDVERNTAQADVVIETVRLAEESAVTNIIKVENEDEDSTNTQDLVLSTILPNVKVNIQEMTQQVKVDLKLGR